MAELALLTFASLVSAIISGMFGMAGGLLLLGILFSVDFPHVIAVPIHGIIMLITYASALFAYFRSVSKNAFMMFVVGAIPGLAVGTMIIGHVDRHFAQIAISLIILYFTWAPASLKFANPMTSLGPNMMFAGFIGSVSSIAIGAAGTFISPLYLRKEWDTKTLIGTKVACLVLLQISKIGVFSFFGFNFMEYIPILLPMGICVIFGNMIGAYCLGKISGETYRVLYKAVLTIAVVGLMADVIIDHLASLKTRTTL